VSPIIDGYLVFFVVYVQIEGIQGNGAGKRLPVDGRAKKDG
jgi:hypothetical protein